jgi:hypothetical protein
VPELTAHTSGWAMTQTLSLGPTPPGSFSAHSLTFDKEVTVGSGGLAVEHAWALRPW